MVELSHEAYYRRHRTVADSLRGLTVAIFGVGAIGSLVADILGRNGLDLVLFDRDVLEIENLCRHAADPSFVGQPKALALAQSLTDRLPDEQSFRGVVTDIRWFSDDQLVDVLAASGAAIVVAATGEDAVDLQLNRVCARQGIPLVIPGLYGRDEALLGEVLFVPWSVDRVEYACFECGRRAAGREDPLPAQPGPIDDGMVIARTTARIVRAFLLPESDEGRDLAERVAMRATLSFVTRTGDSTRHLQPLRRPDCPTCGAAHATFVRRIREALDRAVAPRPPMEAPRTTAPPATQRTTTPRPARPRTERRRPGASIGGGAVALLMLIAGVFITTWAASCSQMSKVNPSAACDARTPFEVVAAIKAKNGLAAHDADKVVRSARTLLPLDPQLKGWAASVPDALTSALASDPARADEVASVASYLPASTRSSLADVFADDPVEAAVGRDHALQLGLGLARTPHLLDEEGLAQLSANDYAGALASFEDALGKSSTVDYEVVAHWGYAAKLRALQVGDETLGVSGQLALAEAVKELGSAAATAYQNALSWPIPVGTR